MKRRRTHHGENSRLSGPSSANSNQHQQLKRNHSQDDDYIPLPIQTFLWRQTSPFVRPFLVKKAREMAQLEQRDACKLFERIIITNNIWGQSPSLTDAIASIDRWRLIKVSFPFVLQCTAALLNNKLIKDHNFNRLGGNEAKMMYTLQWILMSASEECADSENEAKANAANAAIAAAQAASLLKPPPSTTAMNTGGSSASPSGSGQVASGNPLIGSQGSTSSAGSTVGALDSSQSASTVLAARAAAASAAVAGAALPASVTNTQGLNSSQPCSGLVSRINSMSTSGLVPAAHPIMAATTPSSSSVILPVASTAATSALAVGAGSSPSVAAATLQMQQQTNAAVASSSAASLSPLTGTPTPKPPTLLTSANLANLSDISSCQYLLPISSIQMFVYYFAPIMDGLKHSDFLSSNQRLEMGAALWEPLFSHQLPHTVYCLTAPVRPQSLQNSQVSVSANKSSQPASSSSSSFFASGSAANATYAAGSSRFSRLEKPIQQDSFSSTSAFMEASSGARRRSSGAVVFGHPANDSGGDVFSVTNQFSSPRQADLSSSMRAPRRTAADQEASSGARRLLMGTSHSPNQLEMSQLNAPEVNYATYLDIAVLRCLFISDWQESGVYWAMTFLAKRLNEIRYVDKDDCELEDLKLRSRSKSMSHIEADLLCNLSTITNHVKFSDRDRNEESMAKEQLSDMPLRDRNNQTGCKGQTGSKSSGVYLRVEDAETSDSGGDGAGKTREHSRSPVRRLSFSSGMQTLANQIRKTSKRVKKGSDSEQAGADQQQQQETTPTGARRLKNRRSSSAEDLGSSTAPTGVSGSQLVGPQVQEKENRVPTTMAQEIPVLITVSTSSAKQPVPAKRSRLEKEDLAKYTSDDTTGSQHKRMMENVYEKSVRQLASLVRSQSFPSNLHLSQFSTRKDQVDGPDTMGANHYIDEQARIDPVVVLKVLHSLSMRENACSQRVCDKILSLVLRLINIGILSESYNFYRRDSTSSTGAPPNQTNSAKEAGSRKFKDLGKLLPTRRQHEFKLLLHDSSQILKMDSEQQMKDTDQRDLEAKARSQMIHKIFIDILFRLYQHLGCPNNCGMESTVDQHHRTHHSRLMSTTSRLETQLSVAGSKLTFATPASSGPDSIASGKQLRQKAKSTMDFLCAHNKENFISYAQAVVCERPIQQIIDMFHSILGFCRLDYLTNLSHSSSTNTAKAPPTQLAQQQQQQQQHSTTVQFEGLHRQQPLNSLSSPHSETVPMSSSNTELNNSGKTGQLKLSGDSRRLPAHSSATMCHSTNANKSLDSDSLENLIVTNCFKQLITRLGTINKELKLQENTSLYCDIRRLISLIRENFSGVFRSIVLSALIDCVKIQQQQKLFSLDTSQQYNSDGNNRAMSRVDLAAKPTGSDDECSANSGQQMQQIQGRRFTGLGDGGGASAATTTSELATDARRDLGPADDFGGSSGTLPTQQNRGIHPTSDTGSPLMLQHRTSFGSCRYYPPGHPRHVSNSKQASLMGQQVDQQHSQSTGILSLSKAKKKLEQVFGGQAGGSGGSAGAGSGKQSSNNKYEDSIGTGNQRTEQQDEESSRRASIVGHQSMGSFHGASEWRADSPAFAGRPASIPAAQQQFSHLHWINRRQQQQLYMAVQMGLSNFSFLMESCSPGDFLDPALLAALLDLKSPIAIRAAIYLECANLVHRCNRGQWPTWMKMNVASSLHRGSQGGGGGGAGLLGSNLGMSSSKFRKSSSIQRSARSNTLMYRAAGRAFYSWAEAVGARLEELLQIDETSDIDMLEQSNETNGFIKNQDSEPTQQSQFREQPPSIDFFQPTLAGSSSPFALKMAACQLLFEVTTFLRETYRYLPPTIVHHSQAAGAKMGEKMNSIYDVSRAVTANRRWSMALSSLGFGQFPALSAISNAATAQAQAQASAGAQATSNSSSIALLRNPTTSVISEHPERRISFILHETNDENQLEDQSAGPKQRQEGANESASPLAPSVNTQEQQEAAMRKLTSGRNLSQSSASSAVVVAAATCLLRSSGVIDSQTHRRKSIKLRKPTQEKEASKSDKRAKFAQDLLDEEIENSSVSDAGGIRRTDSVRSRRRVSGISEKSDTSEHRNGQANSSTIEQQSQLHQQQPQAADISGDESAGNNSCDEGQIPCLSTEASEKIEADETRMMSNMPWFKAIALVNASIDCKCSHYPTCGVKCYKLHQNMCKRLVSCIQSIYEIDDEHDLSGYLTGNQLECGLAANLMNLSQNGMASGRGDQGGVAGGKGLVRAGSDCSASLLESTSAADQPTAITPGSSSQKLTRKERKAKSKMQQEDQFGGSSQSGVAPCSSSAFRGVGVKGRDMLAGSVGGGISYLQPETLKALTAVKAKKARERAQRQQEEPQIIKYIKGSVKSLLHCPMASFLKGAVILPRDNFIEMIGFSWNLLLEDDQQLSRTAAVSFIIAAIKCPSDASRLVLDELESCDASRKVAAIQKFYVIWDARYQCWPRLEDGAFVHFKMAPPSIEFTLPSPKIAQESKPVVDPPWMPRKTSNVEEVTIGQDQSVQKSFVTATKTRRKQQIEIVTKALREKHDKLREDRENYHITSVPITLYAAYEPTLSQQAAASGVGAGDEMDGNAGAAVQGAADEDTTQQENRALLQMKTAQALFPTCLCQAAIVMINLLDDSRVTYEGSAVYEIASKVIWSCLLEDPALFLRHFFERLTRQNQSTIFQVLRRLIRFMPRLPPQAAYTLYNYLIGFIIYYIRCPVESSQKLISDTLSVLCLTVPSVYGLFLKDLKQILRKEQCDHNLLITANVPSAKKIIVHGSDSSGIPSQFPIDETTQFYHILVDSLEFFGIEKQKQNEYFLIDVRTNHMHNVHSYVRDYYSFKRSQHPQLQLINMDPSKAFEILQKQELINQFLEFGKVSMSLSIVKSHHMAVQRVLFLHEELMKLPTFPRKAIETNFCLFRGELGHQVFSMDRIHKICWVRVIARMFELTSGFFLQLGDIQLFLNAISGIFVLHCEEASVSRLCLATYINATYQFKSIFASGGFMTIMATIVQVYSNHQNNHLLCRSIEFVCKQFYIMHRKPFLLQLFGSVAARLNTAELMQQNQASYPLSSTSNEFSFGTGFSSVFSNQTTSDPTRISPTAFFRLLQSLEKAFKDPLDILELVEAEKPLRAIDFCYQQDKEAIEILDIISLCVTVTAYASESPRSTQMLIILETVVPLYMKFLSASTSKKAGQSMGKQAHKDELQKIQSISICIRTLIVNCDGLTRNFNGPLPSIDFRSSSIRRTGPKSPSSQHRVGANQNNSSGSPMDIYNNEEPSYSGVNLEQRRPTGKSEGNHGPSGGASGGVGGTGRQATISGNAPAAGGFHRGGNKTLTAEESEIARGEFIVPRDTLLNLVAEFLSLSTGRLMESAKKYVDLHQKHSSYELLDVKSHLRLAEIANSLLKFASTDPTVMACRGLIRYMNEILPNTEWRQEAIRPALIMILKRLDKTFNRIAKKTWIKRTTDWEGAKQLLKGAYLTFVKHPYIVHLPHLKSLISCCQNIILSDGLHQTSTMPTLSTTTANLFHNFHSASTSGGGVQVSQSASAVSGGQNSTAMGFGSSGGQSAGAGGNLLNVAAGRQVGGGGAASAPVTSGGQAGPFGGTSSTGSGQGLGGVSVAERFAAAAAAITAASSSSISSQGFNSVTIRLIAMQLLQTSEGQTLESFIGSASMNTPDKLESLMLNFLYPMCIRVCSGAKEAPKLRVCDIMYILNIVLNMLAPHSASSKSCSSTVNSPKSTTDTSQFILSKITTTIGSTQTGATALGIVGQATHATTNQHHQMAQHQESLKIGFLGLKILCVCFETQLASEWIRISRVIRDLALQQNPISASNYSAQQHQPSGPLWDFLDFVATYRFPMFILLLPMIKCQLAKKVREEKYSIDAQAVSYNAQCQRMIHEKIHGCPAATVCRSKSFLFVSLTAELRMLKEQLIAKRRLLLEGEQRQSNNLLSSQHSSAFGAASGGSAATGNALLNPNETSVGGGGLGGSTGADGGDHPFTAYHRLSAALASFANQTATQAKGVAPGSGSGAQAGAFMGTSAALKGACFAAQLATSTPIGAQMDLDPTNNRSAVEHSQSSIRLSGAKTREEARKVMNTILRRTSFPHNQAAAVTKLTATSNDNNHDNSSGLQMVGFGPGDQQRKGSDQRPRQSNVDLESGEPSSSRNSHQIIMDPAMLMAAAFPNPPRRQQQVEGSGILKQLVQTIDRNQRQRHSSQQLGSAEPQSSTGSGGGTSPSQNICHRHE